jgi:hypothetical protein
MVQGLLLTSRHPLTIATCTAIIHSIPIAMEVPEISESGLLYKSMIVYRNAMI